MNRITLIGRLVKDPVYRITPNHKEVVRFTLAVRRPYGQYNDKNDADFINIIAWNKTANIVNEYVRKGHEIGVDGRLKLDSFTNNENRKIYTTEVIADNVTLITRDGEQQEERHSKQEDNVVDFSDFTIETEEDSIF